MGDFIKDLVSGEGSVQKEVEYSLKKYGDTYKWLEEYDKKAITDPEKLAKPKNLRPYLRALQKKNRVRRTDPSV